jgi:8-oxo-dGTP pyrophosphatase MutT (NUDIX family)
MNWFSRVLIVDHHSRFLCVLQRSVRGNFWTFPGGKVELGERPDAAARREVAEEVDIQLGFIHFVLSKTMRVANVHWRGFFYFAPEITREPRIREPEKILDIAFLAADEMRHRAGRPSISSAVATHFLKEAATRDLICYAQRRL